MAGWENYWSSYNRGRKGVDLNIRINKVFVAFSVLAFSIIVLIFFNYKTGRYVQVLNSTINNLTQDVNACENRAVILEVNLNGTQMDLANCNANLQSKSDSLRACMSQKSDISNSLSLCENDLSTWQDNYNALQMNYDSKTSELNSCVNEKNTLRNERDSCNTEKNNLQSRLNAMQANYAKDVCCPQEKSYYRVDGNRVVCTNSTSDSPVGC